MTYTQEQKLQAQEKNAVLFKTEFDYRFVPKDIKRGRGKSQEWGYMSFEKAQRIRAILNEVR